MSRSPEPSPDVSWTPSSAPCHLHAACHTWIHALEPATCVRSLTLSRPTVARLQHQPFLVAEELLLYFEQRLVGLEQLLGAGADLRGESLPLPRLGLEHLLVLHLHRGLVAPVALHLRRAAGVPPLLVDGQARPEEAPLPPVAAGHAALVLVETPLPSLPPALLGDARLLADVELEHLVALLALEPAGDRARKHAEER